MSSPPTDKSDVQNFWRALYKSVYVNVDANLSRETLLAALASLEDMFQWRRHMAVVEMPLAELRGQSVLEIGPGAGGHSALFAKHGARMTSVDITFDRARATQSKFDLLDDLAEGCGALQGDAEDLPFAEGTFDIVYSNGVLHHTHDTKRAMDEVFRVLKPGGQAVIMLYCKSSWHYWLNMFLCVGILQGRAFKDRNWLGKATEWGGRDKQTVENPVTRCYTKSGLDALFARFRRRQYRKAEFYFYLIPKIGRFYRRWQIKHYGTHPGGLLVYGEPWPMQSRLELALGRVMGFSWFIRAEKPSGE